MRKLLITLLLMPATSHAKIQQLEAALEALSGGVSIVIPIIAVLAIVGFGISILAGKEGALRRLLAVLIPCVMITVSIKVLGTFGNSISSNTNRSDETPVVPAVSDETGMFAMVFEWIGSHIFALGVGAGMVGVMAVVVTRALSKRSAGKRIKQNLRDLVAGIENVESQLQYWTAVAPQSDEVYKLTRDSIATLNRVRSRFIGMLEQVHGGEPLTDNQRAAFDIAKSDADKVAGQSADEPISSSDQADAQPVGPLPPAARPQPTTPLVAAAAASVGTGSPFGDMLNPLNPLSPISPFSVWPDSKQESSSQRDDPDQRRTFDTPSVSDEHRHEPSSRSSDCSSSDSSGGSDSGSSGSGSNFD